MELTRAQELAESFRNWFDSGSARQGVSLKRTIEDNRRRYRMILADAAERKELGLSALASTKSTSIVDNAVIDAIQEYYQTDAITFTAEDSADSMQDHQAAMMSGLFKVRARKNGFWAWHIQSLKCGLVDGMEAAMVRWLKESYDYTETKYWDIRGGQVVEISEDEYRAMKEIYPLEFQGPFDPERGATVPMSIPFEDHYQVTKEKKTRDVSDTWECVQLKPGENLMWDFKNRTMDLSRGQWVIVILHVSADDIRNMVKQKILNKISNEDLNPYLEAGERTVRGMTYTDDTGAATDPDTVDVGEFNMAEMWLTFERKNFQWKVTFSLKGEKELSGELDVNTLFFGGRPFDRLPVVMGVSDFELWEAVGRGIPRLIAPIEDELSDHRNNMNDMAKQATTGKYRLSPDTDVDINSLLNDKVFYAKQGEVEKLDFAGEMAVVLRAADMTGGDIASLAPVNMSDPHLVGRGNAKDTLGSVQLAQGMNDKKLNARMLIRNITFMEPLLRVIAEMTMAFENSQKFARIASRDAKIPPEVMDQMFTVVDNRMTFDFSMLDFDVEIQINAGLGTVPRQQKAAKIMQYAEWAAAHPEIGLKLDIEEIDRQLKVLNGFNEDQFVLPPDKWRQPPQPPADDRLNLAVTWENILAFDPQLAMALMQKALSGAMAMTTKVDERKRPEPMDEPEPVSAMRKGGGGDDGLEVVAP